jgi:hypothetical protein
MLRRQLCLELNQAACLCMHVYSIDAMHSSSTHSVLWDEDLIDNEKQLLIYHDVTKRLEAAENLFMGL